MMRRLFRRPCASDCAHWWRVEARDTETASDQTKSCMALEDKIDWVRDQHGDPEPSAVLGWLETNQWPDCNGWSNTVGSMISVGTPDGTSIATPQLMVPKIHQKEMLSQHHGQPGVVHFGVSKL